MTSDDLTKCRATHEDVETRRRPGEMGAIDGIRAHEQRGILLDEVERLREHVEYQREIIRRLNEASDA